MNNRNICKFISPRDQGQLTVKNFIYESEVPHSGKIQLYDTHLLGICVSGEGIFRCEEQCIPIKPGMIFFGFANIPFVLESIKEFTYYYISFSGGRSTELFHRFGITVKNCVFPGYDGLLPLWKESIHRANAENIDLLSESLLLYTFSKLHKVDREKMDVVAFVLSHLEEHFTERQLTLSEVALAAGYNEKYLSHIFKKHFGMGISEYLRLLRIKHAVMLFDNGVTSVKNVAALSGFSDPLYFSKVFTESMGVSPSNYKKRISS